MVKDFLKTLVNMSGRIEPWERFAMAEKAWQSPPW
jgi:hypothetical protein